MNNGGKEYSELGKVLDDIARSRNVRGARPIARWVKTRTNGGPTGAAVSQYLYGTTTPRTDFIERFARAFELTEDERRLLAYTYAYGFQTAA